MYVFVYMSMTLLLCIFHFIISTRVVVFLHLIVVVFIYLVLFFVFLNCLPNIIVLLNLLVFSSHSSYSYYFSYLCFIRPLSSLIVCVCSSHYHDFNHSHFFVFYVSDVPYDISFFPLPLSLLCLFLDISFSFLAILFVQYCVV